MANPYESPAATPRQSGLARLYSQHSVVVATVLGSLAAGIVILVINYRTLGKPALANKTAGGGVALYLLLIGLAALLPDAPALGLVFIAIQASIAYFAADRLQGAAIRYHISQGGQLHSALRAAGIGLLTGLVILFLLIVVSTAIAVITGRVPLDGAA